MSTKISLRDAFGHPAFNTELPSFSGLTRLHQRVFSTLVLVAQIWIHFVEDNPCYHVTALIPMDTSKITNHLFFHQFTTSCEYYKLVLDESPGRIKAHFSPGIVLSKRLQSASMLHRKCQNSCFLFWDFLKAQCADHSDAISIAWRRFMIKPTICLFETDDITINKPQPFWHDVIVITCHQGRKFVLDLTGHQFGLSNWLFDYEGYTEKYVFNPKLCNRGQIPLEALDAYVTAANAGDEDSKRLLELRGELEALSIEDLRRKYGGVTV